MAGWKLKDLDSTTVIDLKSGDIFGRSEGTHKFPECSKMSRQHCQFILENNYAYILDLNSRNGTFVNSVKTDPNIKVMLGNGHILMIGEKTFMVKGGEDATAANKSMIPGIQLEPQRAHSAVANQQATTSIPVKTYAFKYQGSFGELALLLIKNLLFTILTLGIYTPYARTNFRKFIWKSTSLSNSPFLYKANPSALLKSYFLIMLVFVVFVGINKALEIYVVKDSIPMAALVGILNYIFLTVCGFKIAYGAYAFMVNHTTYRSIKFKVKKDGAKDHFFTSLLGTFLSYITLGIYYPFMSINLEKIKWKNTYYGTIPFKFKPENGDYAKLWFKGALLTVFTFGLYYPWFHVNIHKFKLKHLTVGGAKFKSTATGMGYCRVCTKSFLLVLCTLGVASLFVFNLHLSYFLENLSLVGAIDFDNVQQGMKEENNGVSDVAADIFDMDVELG